VLIVIDISVNSGNVLQLLDVGLLFVSLCVWSQLLLHMLKI